MGDRFVKLVGRSYTEHNEALRDHMYQLNRELVTRFKAAFGKALPHLPRQELSWRLHFLVGAVSYTMAGPDLVRLMAGARISDSGNAKALALSYAAAIGGELDLLGQLGPVDVAQLDGHAEQVGAPTGEQARCAIGAVAQLGGRGQHLLPGPIAWSRSAAQHQRHRRGRHARGRRHVLQPGPSHPLTPPVAARIVPTC